MKKYKSNNYFLGNALICTFLALILGSVFYFIIFKTGVFNPFKKAFQDFSLTDVYYSKFTNSDKIDEDLILLNIKHSNRFDIANALNKILEGNPKVIGLDVVFKEKTNHFVDSILKSSLNSEKIIHTYFFEKNKPIESHDYFNINFQNSGYVNFDFSNETVIRNYKGTKDKYKSFTYKVLEKAYPSQFKDNFNKFQKEIPINYNYRLKNFSIIDIDMLNNTDLKLLEDKIILIGYLGTPLNNPFDIEDKHFTPLNNNFTGKSSPDMYGLILHANIIKMFSNQNFIYKTPIFFVFFFSFLFSLLVVFLCLKLKHYYQYLFYAIKKIILLIFTILFLYITIIFQKSGILFYVTPLIALMYLTLEMIYYYEPVRNFIIKKTSKK